MNFKYHNVLLPDGRWTVPGTKPLRRTEVWRAIEGYLYDNYDPNEREVMTVLDIGSLEGGYAVLLTQMGFKVTMLEAREENVRKSCELSSLMGMRIEMIAGDAKEILKGGRKWDIILCAGVLYHMNRPVEFYDLMATRANRSVIVSTHYALEDDARYELPHPVKKVRRMVYKRAPWLFKKAEHALGPITVNELHDGRWYREYQDQATGQEIEKSALASYSNPVSFWLTLDSLLALAERDKGACEILHTEERHHIVCFVSNK